MTEHERLKRIFDEIGYVYGEDLLYEPKKGFMIRRPTGYYDGNPFCIAKSIEIICTPEFMNKLRDYSYEGGDFDMDVVWMELYDNLHDPVTYLYNLLFNE